MTTPNGSITRGRLPAHPEAQAEFLQNHVDRHAPGPGGHSTSVPIAATAKLADFVAEFIDTIKKDKEMHLLFKEMFRQVNKEEKWASADRACHVHDLDHLHRALLSAVSGPPRIHIFKDADGKETGEAISLPIFHILDPLINTGAAFDLFRKKEFNVAMKKLLDGWGDYLKDENSGSNCTLDTGETGWFGEYGLKEFQHCLRDLSFEETYGVKPEEAQAKYKSWDAFFTRKFCDIKKVRPMKVPKNYTPVYNACDSYFSHLSRNVQLHDTFWLKGQNYSLYDMFGGDPGFVEESLSAWAPKFVGASIQQGTLTPSDYHRWHSPIKGTVVATTVLPGTYYAAPPDDGAPKEGFLPEGDPYGLMIRSLPWLSLAATRGIIIMEPQDKSSPIALVAFVAIGMMEVSTINITVSADGTQGKPKHVDAGDEIGIFHFGGSSFVTVIKPKDGYEVDFRDAEDQVIEGDSHYWVNEIIARVVPIKNNTKANGHVFSLEAKL